jgi:hypothetical protein
VRTMKHQNRAVFAAVLTPPPPPPRAHTLKKAFSCFTANQQADAALYVHAQRPLLLLTVKQPTVTCVCGSLPLEGVAVLITCLVGRRWWEGSSAGQQHRLCPGRGGSSPAVVVCGHTNHVLSSTILLADRYLSVAARQPLPNKQQQQQAAALQGVQQQLHDLGRLLHMQDRELSHMDRCVCTARGHLPSGWCLPPCLSSSSSMKE